MIKLFDKYYLDGYENGLVVKEKSRYKNKTTNLMEDKYTPILYYDTIEAALKGLRIRRIWVLACSDEEMTLADFYRRIIRLNKEFAEMVDTTQI